VTHAISGSDQVELVVGIGDERAIGEVHAPEPLEGVPGVRGDQAAAISVCENMVVGVGVELVL